MISFCTAYTDDRSHHLKMTYPENKELCDEYGCEFICIHWTDEWNYSKAWNAAHGKAKGDIQITFGVDYFLNREYIENIIEKFNNDMDIIVVNSDGLFLKNGIIAISAENFKKLGGYDENFIGWGGEDIDFVYRAKRLGLIAHQGIFIGFIPHSDELRFPDGNKNKYKQKNDELMNWNYDNKVINWRDK